VLAPRRSSLPGLRRDAAHERAVQTRQILAAERALEAQLVRAIIEAGRRAAQTYRHDGARAAVAAAAPDQAIAQALRPSVAQIARTFGARVIQGPKSAHAFVETKAFGDLDEAIRRHTASTTATRVVQISDSLRETIRRVIERAQAENLGQEETAALIVEATAGEIAMARARRIARTEIHNAAMYGQQAAAEASPLAFEKVWLSTEDSRTRESHAKANGQRVALNDFFRLETDDGYVHLAYPGDTRAPAGEVINCRCVCLFEPLPIEKPDGGAIVDTVIIEGRPVEVSLPEPEPAPGEDIPTRDFEERPYERPELVFWAAQAQLNTDAGDRAPNTGATVRLIGGNDLYNSPDAPEVDRLIAANPAGILRRRPIVWRITVPAGPALPEGLFQAGGAGAQVASGVGRFGVVTLTVDRVSKVTWGTVAPKPMIELFDERFRAMVEESVRALADPDIDRSAGDVALALGLQIIGARRLDDEEAAPDSVLRALRDTTWNKRSLRAYLQRLLDGDLQDEPGVGEPATDARVILVEATMNVADAIVPQGDQ
tara:strand:- start:2574 stop:4205 length:1632 start_codon:yes stop_codon:yes gene_type:complete